MLRKPRPSLRRRARMRIEDARRVLDYHFERAAPQTAVKLAYEALLAGIRERDEEIQRSKAAIQSAAEELRGCLESGQDRRQGSLF